MVLVGGFHHQIPTPFLGTSIIEILITPTELKYQMAAADSNQANGFSADEFSRYIPRQPRSNFALENAWVSLQHLVHCVMLIFQCVYLFTLQVPPAPANDQREDIPAPDRGVLAEPGRMHDLHHIDVAHQGIVDYHPHPLAVSNFRLSADGSLFDQ